MEELDDDTIANLLNKPKRGSGTTISRDIAGRTRTKKIDFTDRTLPNWFRLFHSLTENEGVCECCGEGRMLAEVEKVWICRLCFVAGKP